MDTCNESAVVKKISTPSPSFKPFTLASSCIYAFKTPKHVIF